MSIVIAARLPDADATLFKRHVEKHGLNTSQAVAALIRSAIAVEREGQTRQAQTTSRCGQRAGRST
jgi:heterodisulfide reductase subunit A-like polyferredoxin